MLRVMSLIALLVLGMLSTGGAAELKAPSPPQGERIDARDIRAGRVIPDEGYCDQPYVVVTRDGNWLCTLTTGPGVEGQKGQHVVSTISADQGKTWSALVDIEPSAGPEASWVVPLVVPSGRVYAFYTYNGDRVATLRGKPIRADTHGWYAFKFSDDHGRSWSAQRYRIPMRTTACDRENDWQGKVQMFWGIDKPKVVGRDVLFAFTKLRRHQLIDGEGWFYRSDNLLVEPDPAKVRWQMLPEGDHGLRAPQFGSVQEEHNVVPLSDGSLYCVYRTTLGFPCHAYSRDGGRTWTAPEPMTYTPGGRRVKNPRACPKLWRTADGRYLFWFHNHGGLTFEGRNPAWICGGIERDGRIHWSQPEILLYGPAPSDRMSYPDLIEQHGRFWVTETQKTVARVHEIDKTLLEGLWSQGKRKEVAREGLALELRGGDLLARETALAPLDVAKTGGLSIDLWARWDEFTPGQVLLDTQDAAGKGMRLVTANDGAVRIELADGKNRVAWESDPGMLAAGKPRHVVAIVDAGPRIIMFVVDGVLCDGGQARPQGWHRHAAPLGDVGGGRLRLAGSMKGRIESLRIYQRPLRTSEAVSNYHAGRSSP
jgi:hypothetical protein